MRTCRKIKTFMVSVVVISFAVVSLLGCVVSYKSEDPQVRIQAVEKMKGQDMLAVVASSDANLNVRLKALEKLIDPESVKIVALNGKYPDTRIAAFNKIDDPKIIKKIALECAYKNVRLAAVKKLNSSDVLYQIAANDFNADVRMQAVQSIYNPELIKKLVLEGKYPDVKIVALKKMDDNEILYQIALETSDKNFGEKAWKKITDSMLLERLVFKTNDLRLKRDIIEAKFIREKKWKNALKLFEHILPNLKEEELIEVYDQMGDIHFTLAHYEKAWNSYSKVVKYCLTKSNALLAKSVSSEITTYERSSIVDKALKWSNFASITDKKKKYANLLKSTPKNRMNEQWVKKFRDKTIDFISLYHEMINSYPDEFDLNIHAYNRRVDEMNDIISELNTIIKAID